VSFLFGKAIGGSEHDWDFFVLSRSFSFQASAPLPRIIFKFCLVAEFTALRMSRSWSSITSTGNFPSTTGDERFPASSRVRRAWSNLFFCLASGARDASQSLSVLTDLSYSFLTSGVGFFLSR